MHITRRSVVLIHRVFRALSSIVSRGFIDRLFLAHCCPAFMSFASLLEPIASRRKAKARSHSC